MAKNFGGNHVISRNRGFGLIEIMVGLVVGLVTMIVIMQVGSVFEGQKRAITSGGDAQTNGALGLYAIEREVRTAGNGMTEGVPLKYPPLAGCLTHVFDTSSYLVPNKTGNPAKDSDTITGGNTWDIRFVPVIASDGGGGLSDSLTVIYGSSVIAAPYFVAQSFATATDVSIGLESAPGIQVGDMVALVDRTPGPATIIQPDNAKGCSLMQVTGAPAPGTGVVPVTAGTRYNKAGGNAPTPVSYSIDSVLYDLGRLNITTYRIHDNDLVADVTQFGVTPNGTPTPTAVTNRTDESPLVSNIVNMQVQYGIDTGNPMGAIQTNCNISAPGVALSKTDADGIIDPSAGDLWVDPAGAQWGNNGTSTPALADLQRIRAVRIGLVARSGVKEPPNRATGLCDITTTPPVIHWDSGPNMTPDLAADPDWMCYRYKIFQTTIPVRNALWSSTMNPASAASCR